MSEPLPVIEIVKQSARIGSNNKPCCYVYILKYNGRIHQGGWSHKAMAESYADRLFNGSIKPKLLPEKR